MISTSPLIAASSTSTPTVTRTASTASPTVVAGSPTGLTHALIESTTPLEACPDGMHTGSSVPEVCGEGFSCPEGSWDQTRCPIGFFADTTVLKAQWQNSTAVINQCRTGRPNSRDCCSPCPASYYCKPSDNDIKLGRGQSMPGDHNKCPRGYECPAVCCSCKREYCPADEPNDLSPMPCRAGLYASKHLLSECDACPGGTYGAANRKKTNVETGTCPEGQMCTDDCQIAHMVSQA